MIASLKGILISIQDTAAVIDVNGVGYLVEVPEASAPLLGERIQQEVNLYTHMIVREDAQELYGFLDENQRELFRLLITAKGVGPRGAHKILSSITVEDFCSLVAQGNAAGLTRLPGIGKKGAEQIVLDLKKKIVKIMGEVPSPVPGIPSMPQPRHKEAVSALVALGYRAMDAEGAVARISGDLDKELSVEEIIKHALAAM
jgi:Holliday junction DNA helicase RuvA